MPSKRPWMKFFPSDWQADQLLGMCSLAARGLWMEMLAIMHRADPHGHLLVNGKKPSDEQLAALARAPVDQVRALTHELEEAGVFSRSRNGTIYSRRMTTDEKKRKDGETAALTGGSVPGSRRSQAAGNKGKIPPPPRVVGGVASQPPPHPEAICQKKPPDPPSADREFEGFYQAYPRHIGRGQALKAWRSALKKAEPSALVAAAHAFAKRSEATEERFIPHPATWLNGERWLDGALDRPPPEPDAPYPKGGIVDRAIEAALNKQDKGRADEIFKAARRSLADAERMATTYLGEAA
ncbi:hypothetical protein [Inquilinus limosus]|uniref:hypothetical protein n=1 Tax=Inquilinus limosus TaxID=171674 RepID=UPI001198273D|nr:hypothetical protein [Inquilinus limosus]